jgi:DNA-binding protein HU-beta
MNKTELIEAIANTSGLSKADAARALDAFTTTVGGALAGGDKVTVTGFGTFKGTQRAARKGVNPKNGQPIDIAAHTVVSFKAGSGLKESL